MSALGKARIRGAGGKAVKLPEGASEIKKCVETLKSKPGVHAVEEKVEEICDNLMTSDWQPHNSRPKHDFFGYYAICRWYAKDSMWVILYVGRGHLRDRLEYHFSGKQRKAIGGYLSSFPKSSRNLIWIKWFKDPFFPYEDINLEHLIYAIQEKYNNSERPAFNLEEDGIAPKEEELPEDFSIIPDWHKPAKKKKKAAQS